MITQQHSRLITFPQPFVHPAPFLDCLASPPLVLSSAIATLSLPLLLARSSVISFVTRPSSSSSSILTFYIPALQIFTLTLSYYPTSTYYHHHPNPDVFYYPLKLPCVDDGFVSFEVSTPFFVPVYPQLSNRPWSRLVLVLVLEPWSLLIRRCRFSDTSSPSTSPAHRHRFQLARSSSSTATLES